MGHRVDNLEDRVTDLEEMCQRMNDNISSLQSILEALKRHDYVTSVETIYEGGVIVGYAIHFAESDTINIYHGKSGKDGANGSDGTDGADGRTPVIGVKKDTDGIYYWTVDGAWLRDSQGNKVRAEGRDGQDGADGEDGANGENGQDGADGEDGITPQLKIEDDYWYISYDEGATWTKLDKATGEDGANGTDGADGEDSDSFFASVDTTDPNYVVITLIDGTEIKLPTWTAFEALQTLCNEMNTNIKAIQTIVDAIENNDYVESITPLIEGGKEIGYVIKFTKSGMVTIYHGKDGADGENGQDGTNGEDGKDGADGVTPVIGVRQHSDGIYYWTLNGEWLLDDNGNMIKAQGNDGQDGASGENGQDGITPQLKIENGYWYISYDEGTTWTELGKATGEDGADGANGADGNDGDSFFASVDTSDPTVVVFTLSDGTVLTLPTSSALSQLNVTFVPKFKDGKVVIDATTKLGEFDFVIAPASAIESIAANYADMLTLEAINTITRSVEFIDMPITECVADVENGVISVTASGENLADAFYAGATSYSAILTVADKATSDFIPLAIPSTIGSDDNEGDEESNSVTISFESDGIALGKSQWATGDIMSAFIGSTANQRLKYMGITDVATGIFDLSTLTPASKLFDGTVILYPYNGDYAINATTLAISGINLPSVQHYNVIDELMVAYSSDNELVLKDAYCWLKVQLTGEGQKVNSIAVRGNGGEQVAGAVVLNPIDASFTLAAEPAEGTTEVVLNCGSGVELTAEATAFYVALPPQSFESGITVEVSALGYQPMTLTLSEALTLARNTIQPIAAVAFNGEADTPDPEPEPETPEIPDPEIPEVVPGANNVITYTTTNNVALELYTEVGFGANVVSNDFDKETKVGTILFDGDVTQIANWAFKDTGLKTIVLPGSITKIGDEAFYNCTALTSIELPNTVTSIGISAFYNCQLMKSVTLSSNLTTIKDYAFQGCNGLESINLPESVTTVGEGAFWDCDGLTAFYGKFSSADKRCFVNEGVLRFFAPAGIEEYSMPSGITIIENNAIRDYDNIVNFTIHKDVVTIEDCAFYHCGALTSITIPDNVTSIGNYAFGYCSELKSAHVGDGVEYIYRDAFNYCSKMTDIYIGKSVKQIFGGVFSNCNALERVDISDIAAWVKIRFFEDSYKWSNLAYGGGFIEGSTYSTCYVNNNPLSKAHNLYLNGELVTTLTIPEGVKSIANLAFYGANCITKVVIPEGLTRIEGHAFNECDYLETITLSKTVEYIGVSAFRSCDALKRVSIPDGVKTIDWWAFSLCPAIKSVNISNSVTLIGHGAFYECSSLTNVSIGSGIKSINGLAFWGCKNLGLVYCAAVNVPTLDDAVFNSNASDRKIYVPVGSVDAYKAAKYWSNYSSAILGYEFE